MDLPCIDCLLLPVCIRLKHDFMFSLINKLGKRCSLLTDYLTLADIKDINFPAPEKEKHLFNELQRPRIEKLAIYMKWDYDLSYYFKGLC